MSSLDGLLSILAANSSTIENERNRVEDLALLNVSSLVEAAELCIRYRTFIDYVVPDEDAPPASQPLAQRPARSPIVSYMHRTRGEYVTWPNEGEWHRISSEMCETGSCPRILWEDFSYDTNSLDIVDHIVNLAHNHRDGYVGVTL